MGSVLTADAVPKMAGSISAESINFLTSQTQGLGTSQVWIWAVLSQQLFSNHLNIFHVCVMTRYKDYVLLRPIASRYSTITFTH